MTAPSDYLPVRINTLRTNAPITFDIFIEIGDRFIHYMRETDPIDDGRLKNLKAKGVRKLFIQTDSEPRYLDYLEAGLDTLRDSGISVEERGGLAHDSMVTTAENAEKSLETEQGYRRTEGQFGKIIEFLMADRGAIKSILSAAGCSMDNHAHAATVSTLTLSLATSAGITDSKQLFDLGIASLVHDLGKNHLGIDPMKPRKELTEEEKKLYMKHPEESVAILSGKPFITPHVLGLVSNHEEIGRGRGFPEKKDYTKLKKPYQILNLCNDFERFCHEQGVEPLKAIDSYFEARGQYFTEELIGQLATVLT